jgi:hypothetical protein
MMVQALPSSALARDGPRAADGGESFGNRSIRMFARTNTVSSARRFAPALSGLLAALLAAGAPASFGQAADNPAMKRARLDAAAQSSDGRAIVTLAGPADAAAKAQLEGDGLRLEHYLGEGRWQARVTRGSRVARLSQNAALARVEPLTAGDKLDRSLRQGKAEAWARTGAKVGGQDVIGAYVLFQDDVDLDLVGYPLVVEKGFAVVDELRTMNGVVVEAPADDLKAFASDPRVRYIETALPALDELNAENRAVTGANAAQAAPYHLDGSGLSVMVYDGGRVRTTHVDFGGRVGVPDNTTAISTHATHVAATIAGNGASSGGLQRGMAPGAWIDSYGARFSAGGVIFYTNPGDIEVDYYDAINVAGADIANNSVGSNVSINNYDCALLGDYGVTAALLDGIVRGSLGAPFRVVFAVGNERAIARCTTDGWRTIAPPAGAKNPITVGAVYSDTLEMTTFSSWGPTDDGRLKPDVVAPGCQVGGDGGVTSADGLADSGYRVMCGTSMAAPTFTGLATLLMQDYRARYGGPDPRNATLKAIFTHTAMDLGPAGPDYQHGYGLVQILPALEVVRTGRFGEESIDAGDTFVFQLDLPPGESELRVTIAWDDVPAAASATNTLVNDLDLRLIAPDGTVYYPWTLNPASPAAPAVRNQPDRINNIEQVLVESPPPGSWRVEVVAFNVVQGPQTFSYATSRGMNPLPRVQIALDDGLPQTLPAGDATPVAIRVRTKADTLAAAPTMWFRYTPEAAFEAVEMTPGAETDQFTAMLPPPVCGASPEFYFVAAGVAAGEVRSPADAPASVHQASVGGEYAVFSDDFEAPSGWTVVNSPTLTDGAWEPGLPLGGGDRGDPFAAFGGSGQCYLTGNRAGNSDVDDGTTSLISPRFDLSEGDALVRYALWYTNGFGEAPNSDYFNVYLSDDDGQTWTLARSHGPESAPGWNVYSFRAGAVRSLTATMRLRFDASDLGAGSVVEAAVDAVRVVRSACDGALADCNGNGILDAADIADGRSADIDGDGLPDECDDATLSGDLNCDGEVNVGDIGPFVVALTDPVGYASAFPECDYRLADVNRDGVVSVGDIAGMVALISVP